MKSCLNEHGTSDRKVALGMLRVDISSKSSHTEIWMTPFNKSLDLHRRYKDRPCPGQHCVMTPQQNRSFMVNPLSYFSFQPVLHDWCNKGHGMCYPACGMVHIKEPMLLIGKNSPCGGSGFPLSLSEWYFTICLTPYNRK